MHTKHIIVVVDNRAEPAPVSPPEPKDLLKGSAFKATEIDLMEQMERNCVAGMDHPLLMLLQERVAILEARVSSLFQSGEHLRRKKRLRRRANEISKQHECPVQECGKLYGSQTSLKNHLKLKHGRPHPNAPQR